MDRKERFIKAYNYLKYEGIIKTQEDVALKMKCSRPNVSSALNGHEKVLTDSFIGRFCAAYPHISYAWLMSGRGEMVSDQGKTILERIREILKIERKSATELAETYGGHLEGLQDLLDNDIEPNVEIIDEFCRALKINRDWVIRGVDDPKGGTSHALDCKEKTSKECMRPRLPMAATYCGLHAFINGKKDKCEMVPVVRQFPDYDFTMYIRDDSMAPKYERGDEIALKEVVAVKEWGKDYALDTEDGIIFKRIYDAGKDVRCVSYNGGEYHDFLIPKTSIIGYFRFVGLIRV